MRTEARIQPCVLSTIASDCFTNAPMQSFMAFTLAFIFITSFELNYQVKCTAISAQWPAWHIWTSRSLRELCSGCKVPTSSPEEGDVRLVPLNGATAATAACDDVHFGGVEMFFQGRWGRFCNTLLGLGHDVFTLDAQVVCRQLGFPFGTVMDEDVLFYDTDAEELEENIVWASEV